jgi:hypothetical protein
VPDLIRGMDGAEKFGRKYRLPLHSMPPSYLLAAKLLEPVRAINWPERDGSEKPAN